MNKYILFYSNRCIHCNKLINIINNKTLQDKFKYISVDDNTIKIPEIIKSVPTLIVKGINKPLIGKEVFLWLESQDYLNIDTNNIYKNKMNPQFIIDNNTFQINGISQDLNYVSIGNDERDTDLNYNKTSAQFNKINEMFITDDINKKIKDSKIDQDLQNSRLNQLLSNRSLQIETLLNNNKKY